jgi:ribonuclease E
VWLPSGGYLVIDRTEAMTVVDVNTGKFTGSGGNLEETVTRNNLEAAEEIIRQLRLRDIGGIIVIDFIDMVLESNRDLVLRRLTECLGRDRTRHQVAEVTSLGLVQMTRKKVGTGLLEAYSSTCEHCKGRGVLVSAEPVNVRQPAPAVVSSGASGVPSGARDSGNGTGRRVKSRGRGTGAVPAAAEQTVIEELPVADVAVDQVSSDYVAEDQSAVDRAAPEDVEAPAMARRRRAASRPAGPPATELAESAESAAQPFAVPQAR